MILVNCDGVHLYCTVFVVSIFERIASKKKDFYYVYVAKLYKAKIIQSTISRDKCNISLKEDAAQVANASFNTRTFTALMDKRRIRLLYVVFG